MKYKIGLSLSAMVCFSLGHHALASSVGFSSYTPLNVTSGGSYYTGFDSTLEARSEFDLIDYLSLETSIRYTRSNEVQFDQSSVSQVSNRMFTAHLTPIATYRISSTNLFVGVSLDWHLHSASDISAYKSLPTKTQRGWFEGAWGGAKPDLGWVLGAAYAVTPEVSTELRLIGGEFTVFRPSIGLGLNIAI